MEEVHGAFGTSWAPAGSPAHNPAFDVTPAKYVTSLILDTGVIEGNALVRGALWDMKESLAKK